MHVMWYPGLERARRAIATYSFSLFSALGWKHYRLHLMASTPVSCTNGNLLQLIHVTFNLLARCPYATHNQIHINKLLLQTKCLVIVHELPI